jgi:hypothetical protein
LARWGLLPGMTTPNTIHGILAAQRTDDSERAAPPPMPRLGGHDVAAVLSLLAGLAGLLAIAAPSL